MAQHFVVHWRMGVSMLSVSYRLECVAQDTLLKTMLGQCLRYLYILRPCHMHSMRMWLIATDRVAWSVCLCLCVCLVIY